MAGGCDEPLAPSKTPILPLILLDAGYTTACFGTWHITTRYKLIRNHKPGIGLQISAGTLRTPTGDAMRETLLFPSLFSPPKRHRPLSALEKSVLFKCCTPMCKALVL